MSRQNDFEKQLDDEIRFDYEQRIADKIRSGMSEAEARRATRLEFGGLEQVKEECREARTAQWLDSILQDVRYGLRNLRRARSFTGIAVTMLALGIGINAAVFTLTDTVLFKGFPLIERNDRILYISGPGGVSWPDFQDWRAQTKSFTGLAVVADLAANLSDKSGNPESYAGTRLSANAFQIAGQRPILGRDFAPSDETPLAPPVTILSYHLWERRYAKDPAIIGQSVRINGTPATVIGVMPRGFTFPQRQDLWMALTPNPDLQKRENRGLWFAFGRMTDGTTIASARAEMTAIGKRLTAAYPLTNRGYSPGVLTFSEHFIGRNSATIYGSMWGAVGFVLLIACANLANLTLARGMNRSREISVRMALGAGRWRIVRQLLIESVILSVFGGIFGLGIAAAGVRAWDSTAGPPAWFDHVLDYSMDYRALSYLIVISIGTGLLFGLAPALRLSKTVVSARLKDGGRGSTGGGRGRHLATLLVAVEMALAVVLLAGAGVMIRSFLNVYATDLGVKTANVLTMQLGLPHARYPAPEAQSAFYRTLKTRMETIPGVESVAITRNLPAYGSGRLAYQLEGADLLGEKSRPKLSALSVSPDYFRTLEASLVAGRDFNGADGQSGIPAMIVNERFANQHWPGENPLGKRLRFFGGDAPEAWCTVVGVVSNIVQYRGDQAAMNALVYLPFRQREAVAGRFVIVRTRIPAGSIGNALQGAVHALDSDLPVSYFMTLDDRLTWAYAFNGSVAALFLVFAAVALLLASAGLYAVIAHSVSRRTQEIGVRMAIGATARDIRGLVFRQGMAPLGIGLAIGLVSSSAVNRILKSVLGKVSPADPFTLAIASLTLIAAATLGCIIPALRATRVDPVVALRHE